MGETRLIPSPTSATQTRTIGRRAEADQSPARGLPRLHGGLHRRSAPVSICEHRRRSKCQHPTGQLLGFSGDRSLGRCTSVLATFFRPIWSSTDLLAVTSLYSVVCSAMLDVQRAHRTRRWASAAPLRHSSSVPRQQWEVPSYRRLTSSTSVPGVWVSGRSLRLWASRSRHWSLGSWWCESDIAGSIGSWPV
jgi:hypothetical protein